MIGALLVARDDLQNLAGYQREDPISDLEALADYLDGRYEGDDPDVALLSDDLRHLQHLLSYHRAIAGLEDNATTWHNIYKILKRIVYRWALRFG